MQAIGGAISARKERGNPGSRGSTYCTGKQQVNPACSIGLAKKSVVSHRSWRLGVLLELGYSPSRCGRGRVRAVQPLQSSRPPLPVKRTEKELIKKLHHGVDYIDTHNGSF